MSPQDPAVQARQMRDHAQEFTNIERTGLRTWFDLDQAGHDVDADRFLNAWLQFEHYTSLLPSDPSLRTPAMLTVQMELQLDANNELGIAQSILASTTRSKLLAMKPVVLTPAVRDSSDPE